MFPKLALSITSFIPLYSFMIVMYGYGFYYGEIGENSKKYIIGAVMLIVITQLISIIYVGIYIKDKESTRIAEAMIAFNNIKEDKKVYVNYMMTYLLPLLMLDLDKISEFYIVSSNMLIILFIVMNAKGENFNFNVILSVKGYAVYHGINSDEDEKILIIKKGKVSNIRANHPKFKFVSFGGSKDIYLCKEYN